MPKYKVKSSGKTYIIPEDKVQAFLTDFPDAFLVEEEGKPNGPAKETAVAGPMTEAQQKAVDMESPLVGGFSELPETKINPVKWQAAKPVEKAKMLTQEYGEDFKFEFNDPTDPRTVTVSSANGAEQTFNLENFDQVIPGAGGYMGMGAQGEVTQAQQSEIQEFEKFFIENASNEDEAYNFVTTGIKPGDYATFISEAQPQAIGFSGINVMAQPTMQKADAQEQRDLIDTTYGQVQKMYLNPSEYGIVDTDKMYSSGFDSYTEEEKNKNLDLVYQKVKENSGLNIDKDSFVQIYDNVFQKATRQAALYLDARQNTLALTDTPNPAFFANATQVITEQLDYSPQEKIKALLLESKIEKQRELKLLQDRLDLAEGTEQAKQLTGSIATIEGEIKIIDSNITKNAQETVPGPNYTGEARTETNSQLDSQYFSRIEKQVEKQVGNIQGKNPGITKYEAVQQAYDRRILQMQSLQSNTIDDKITLDFSNPITFQSPTPGLKTKIGSPVLSTLIKNGFDLDKSGKVEIALFDLISLGIKPDDLSGGGVETDEKDILNYRMFKETYDEDFNSAKALRRLLDLEESPESMIKEEGFKNVAQNAIISIARDVFDADPDTQEKLSTLGQGERTRLVLDRLNEVAQQENFLSESGEVIDFTDKDYKAFERTFSESFTEGTGQTAGIFTKILAINAMSGGVLGLTGATNFLQALSKGDKFNKLLFHGASALIEEANMQMAGLEPTAGLAFYGVGALNRHISPFKNSMRSLNPLYMTATAGPSGAFAMEFAGLTEAAFSDLMDNSDFSKSFDDLYGDVDETTKRILVNSLMFTTLHLPHVKKYDFMSTGQKIKVRNDLEGQLESLSIDAMDPSKTDAEKQKIEKNAIGIEKSIDAINSYILRETGAGDLNPNSPTFKEDLNNLYIEPINLALRKVDPKFKGITVITGEGEKFREEHGFTNLDSAIYDRGTDKKRTNSPRIIIDTSRGNVLSKTIHEATHAALDVYFESNQGARERFNNNVANIFSNTVLGRGKKGEAKLGSGLEADIEKQYESEKLNEQQKSEEYIANMLEMLFNPEFYFTEVAPTFISEIRNEFRIRQDVAGLDGSPTPQTADELVQYFADLGYKSRTGRFDASIFAKLGDIDLFKVESGEAREQNIGEKVVQAVTLKSKGEYNSLNELYEKSERDLKALDRDGRGKYDVEIAKAGARVIMSVANRRWGNISKDAIRNGTTFNEFVLDLSNEYIRVAKTYKPELDINNQGIDSQTSTLFNLKAYKFGGELADKMPLSRETIDKDLESIISKSSGYDYYSSAPDAATEAFENMDLSIGGKKRNTSTLDGLIDLPFELDLSQDYIDNIVEAIEKSGVKQKDINYKTLQAFNINGQVSADLFTEAMGLAAIYPETSSKKGQINKQETTENLLNWLETPLNAELLYNILPLQLRLTPTGLSQATGIKKTVLDRFYIKSDQRVKTSLGGSSAGAYIQVKAPMAKDGVFDHARFLETIAPEGLSELSGGDKSTINALFAEMGKATYNQVYRFNVLSKDTANKELERIKDGSSDRLKSRISDFVNSLKYDITDKKIRIKFAEILNDPLISDKEKVSLIANDQISGAPWNQQMKQFNKDIVAELKSKYKGNELDSEIINAYKSNVNFLTTRSTYGFLFSTNPGKTISGERATNQYEVALATTLSLIPKDKTFATSNRNIQQAILNTLGSTHGGFTINGKKITKEAVQKDKKLDKLPTDAQFFDAIMEYAGVGEGASNKKGTSTRDIEYDVSSKRVNSYTKKYEEAIEKAEMILDPAESERAKAEAVETFRTNTSVKGKNYAETQKERQQFLTDFFLSISKQIEAAEGNQAKYDVINGAMDLLQLQTSRGSGIVRSMVPFDVLTTDFSTRTETQRAYRIEHFLPIARMTDAFIKNSSEFIQTDGYSKDSYFENVELGVRRASQGLITESVRQALDKGGNTARQFENSIMEIPPEHLLLMVDISGEKTMNLAQKLAEIAFGGKLTGPSEGRGSELLIQTNAYINNQEGYQNNTNKNIEATENATGEPINPLLTTNGEVFQKMKEVEAKMITEQRSLMKSKSLSTEFNDFIEEKTGLKSTRVFSQAEAQAIGQKSGKVRLISSSAQDFEGLNYRILAKGKKGLDQQTWFDDKLYKPLNRAELATASYRRTLFQDFDAIKQELKVKGLQDNVANTGFTKEQAVRVYMWDKQGMEIPGIKKGEINLLSRVVKNDPTLKAFADKLIYITKQDGYASPNEAWAYGSISTDLNQGIRANTRSRYMREFVANADEIYSTNNLNKLEASFGTAYRKSLEKTLARIKSGRNRLLTGEVDADASRLLNYINNSTGVIMFLNTRSATLQLTSATNFINYSDNNVFKAGKAFANQPQYWKDFTGLFNSDYLRDRRGGNKINIAENEITEAANNSKNKASGVVNYILSKGFLPTQMADSFAIASGGATFYRNRINTYLKQGLDAPTAERKAYEDFYDQAEKSQQSSKPQRVSQQQAGPVGRVVLAFANTPSQYARLIEKSALDMINGRGSKIQNAGKITYYAAVQNLMFNFLQQATFALLNEDEPTSSSGIRKKQEAEKAKSIELLNGMADSILRGMGWQGAAVSTVKNVAFDVYKRSKKDRPEYSDSFMEALDFSPPIGSKLKKIKNAFSAIDRAGGFKKANEAPLDTDNPYITAGASLSSGVANLPLDRLLVKIQNIEGAMNDQNEEWQRLMMFLGWPDWQLGMEDEKKGNQQQSSPVDNLKIKGFNIPKLKIN